MADAIASAIVGAVARSQPMDDPATAKSLLDNVHSAVNTLLAFSPQARGRLDLAA